MRKELVVCLLVLGSFCLTVSAEAQLFRRWVSPPQQQCPQQFQQQAAQRQLQYQLQAAQLRQQVQVEQTVERQTQLYGAQPQETRNLILVEVDQRGRVLRQLLDGQQLSQMIRARMAAQQQTAGLQQQPRYMTQRLVPVQTAKVPVLPQPTPPSRVVAPQSARNQAVVTGYAVPVAPSYNSNAGTQVDIARQAQVASPALTGPSAATSVELTEPAPTAETVLFIEPAEEAPAGSLRDEGLFPDPAVVPATATEATEEEPGSISILDLGLQPTQGGVSVLEPQGNLGNGSPLLTGPEGN